MYYNNNYFYGYDIGKSPFTYNVLLDPKNFDISIINEDNYGTNDFLGPLYNVDPRYNEINIELNHNYHKIKSEILTDFYINENKTLKLYSNRQLLSNNTNNLFDTFILSSLFFIYLIFKI